MPDGQGGTWVTLAEAGRRLDRAPDTLRKRAKRGQLEYPTRQDNRGQWLILLPDEPAMPAGNAGRAAPDMPRVPGGMPEAAGIAGRIAVLEERLAAAEGEQAELVTLRERAAALEAELAALRAEAGQTALRLAERDAALADARIERDRWREMAERHAAAIERLVAEAWMTWVERLLRWWRRGEGGGRS